MSKKSGSTSRIAVVVDGDNVARGGQLNVEDVTAVLARVAELSRGWQVTLAMQSKLAARYLSSYSTLGWRLRFASMAPDAADEELLGVARGYVETGATALVVVSGDHAFADLAKCAPLHVICYRKSLSNRLRFAATSISFLDDVVPAVAA